MGRALSMDLRERVVSAIDVGLSCRAAVPRFGVSRCERNALAAADVADGQGFARPLGR